MHSIIKGILEQEVILPKNFPILFCKNKISKRLTLVNIIHKQYRVMKNKITVNVTIFNSK